MHVESFLEMNLGDLVEMCMRIIDALSVVNWNLRIGMMMCAC